MYLSEKVLKITTQILLLAVIALVPFIKIDSLYFPFVSGKAYLFRSLIAIAFFFWVWLMLRRKEYRPNFKHILVMALPLFFLAQVAAAFFGVDPVFSLFSSIERADGVVQYGFWVLYFLIFTSVFTKRWDWKLFFIVFITSAFFSSAYSWYYQGFQAQLKGVFGNPAYFAGFLIFAIGFSFLAFERKVFDSRFANNVCLAAGVFFTVTLLFTQVRGSYVGLAGGIFLFSVLSLVFLRKENKKLAYAAGVLVLLGFISLAILFAAKDTEFVQNTRHLYRITEVTEIWEKASTRERLLNWNIALKAFAERPVFGYGPENYGSAANRYYDYRIGVGEPWFDRAHNQVFDTLATGGIVVFSFYVFWLAAAVFLIFKIAKEKKTLSFLLASILFAYFLQSLFLFDLLAVYIGLFPFLAFLIYSGKGVRLSEGQPMAGKEEKPVPVANMAKHVPILGLVAVAVAFVVYTTVFVPYKANAAVLQFFAYSENGFYKESSLFLKESLSIQSPYTTWEVRKRAGWQFVNVLEYKFDQETDPEKIKEIAVLYDLLTLELERFAEARPYDPQIYFVLGRMYRFGFEKLGKDDLGKAETLIRKGLTYSDLRVEYSNEFANVLLLQGKFEEAETVVRDYGQRVKFDESFPYVTLGHFYFVAKRYELAMEQYEKAREAGYEFSELGMEYNRYIYVAQQAEEYQKIIDMAKEFLARWGDDADTYFNIAVGHLRLGDQEHAKEFFLKALELDPAYEEYEHRAFFLDS